jgi:hypothetical protein
MYSSAASVFASHLLRAYELTGENLFYEHAAQYIKAYDHFAWNSVQRNFFNMLALEADITGAGKNSAGEPIRCLEGTGSITDCEGVYSKAGYSYANPYDPYNRDASLRAAGYVDMWRINMFSQEFPIIAAQTAVYAYEQSKVFGGSADSDLLAISLRWREAVERAMPVMPGRRFGIAPTTENSYYGLALEHSSVFGPGVWSVGGSYAENYGRVISFYVKLYLATGEPEYLSRAKGFGREAIQKLWHGDAQLFRGHPMKSWYHQSDGVGLLLHALLEIHLASESTPDAWEPAF